MKAIGSSYRQVIAQGGHQSDETSKLDLAPPTEVRRAEGALGKRLAYQDEDDDDFVDEDEKVNPHA